MGRGDIKTKKGKISNGSFGNSRKRKVGVSYPTPATVVAVEEVAPKKAAKKTTKKTKEAE